MRKRRGKEKWRNREKRKKEDMGRGEIDEERSGREGRGRKEQEERGNG